MKAFVAAAAALAMLAPSAGRARVAAGPQAVASSGALGANYNEHFEDVDYRDLEKAQTHWVRIFLPMPQIDRDGAAGHGAVQTILDAHKHGYHTLFTLKWPYNRSAFPKAGSKEMKRELARLDEVLPLVVGKVDILEIGNEPFIESLKEDRGADLNAFYETMARHVIQWRKAHCPTACATHLYMGSLTRLEFPKDQTATTERWMTFVKNTPEIDGVDIHPHVSDIAQSKAYLDYVLPRMRADQKFISTEFSLIWWWKQQMKKPVAPAFARMYHLPSGTLNWQVIADALANPFGKSEWDDFLALSPWFETRRHYLVNQMKLFRDTGRLEVATYGFKQGSSMSADFGPDKDPWLINSVFAARSVHANPDGSAAYGYGWIQDFRALQR
ncbi:hypothetical protein KY084_03500 [Stakelama sp. CBK3Z-3]|uniref:Asl1-like glycosyl hydrolase catalytic domain-containing protein n=1 Tax=Stakelama flava TaxID=2860338 RepID=A0ABS6XKK3_9SPHN|nr:hypothetical protein [Stakelama flava]MBW4329940.1 hypothetical protein [Stakelama flava]